MARRAVVRAKSKRKQRAQKGLAGVTPTPTEAAKKKRRRRRLTLDYLIRNELPVYVENNTRPRGQILISFVTVGGKASSVQIPRTRLPICMNDYLPPQVIGESHDLRQYLRKDDLLLVDPVEAERILSTKAAQRELAELRRSNAKARNAVIEERRRRRRELSQNPDSLRSEPGSHVDGMPYSQGVVPQENQYRGDPSEIINGRVMQIVLRLGSKDIKVRDALRDLKAMSDELNEPDFSYLVANTKGTVQSWAQGMLARMDDDEVDEDGEEYSEGEDDEEEEEDDEEEDDEEEEEDDEEEETATKRKRRR